MPTDTRPATRVGEYAIFGDGRVKQLTKKQLDALRRGQPVLLSPAGATFPRKVGDPQLFT